METAEDRAALEERWRRKVDQIVLLSMAYHDAVPPMRRAAATEMAPGGDARLMSRVLAEHQELAEIEEALDRIKSGSKPLTAG